MAQESQHTEWKESWRDDHLRWVCGFANAEGGRLEIGRSDAGAVVGLAEAPKLLEDLPNKIRDLLGIFEACRAAGEPEPRLRSLANDLWLEFPFAPEYVAAMSADRTALTTPEVTGEVTGEVRRLVNTLHDQTLGRSELQSRLALKRQANFRVRYLLPALAAGLVEMTIPDKPNSRLQKYRLTAAGKGS